MFGDYLPTLSSQNVNQILTYSFTTTTVASNYQQNFTHQDSDNLVARKTIAGTHKNIETPLTVNLMNTRSHIFDAWSFGNYYTSINDLIETQYNMMYPTMFNNQLYIQEAQIVTLNTIMGKLPGLLYPISPQPFPASGGAHIVAGTDDYAGSNFHIFSAATANGGQYFIHDGEWGIE